MQRITHRLESLLLLELRQLVLWVPVCVALGCAAYFTLRFEPSFFWGVSVPSLLILAGMALAGRTWHSLWGRMAGGAIVALALGFVAAWCAGHKRSPQPELPRRATEISGRVLAVTAGLNKKTGNPIRTLELADARFETPLDSGMPPLQRTLALKTLPSDAGYIEPESTVWLRAMLMPPPFPAFPGGPDLQRTAWFAGVAGYGRLLAPVEVLSEAPFSTQGAAGWLNRTRQHLDERIRRVLPDARGAVAATLLVGEAESLPQTIRQDFAVAGLAHILAVAGLHLGLVMAICFGVTRLVLAAWERAALRWPCKTIAACTALSAGVGYAALTGLHVPVLRSLVMACVAVAGLAAGRRVVSLRGLALAAVLLLLWHPENVLNSAFQMSFSAVMALAAGYDVLGPRLAAFRAYECAYPLMRAAHWVLGHVLVLSLTSLLAGLAVLPLVMAHFGEMQPYFIAANLLAVPLMAVWIMPWGMCALALMPVHMEALALRPMSWGIAVVQAMAHGVAHWPAARVLVPHMPTGGVVCVMLGLCWLCLWRQKWRVCGVMLLAVGVASSFLAPRPDVLVSADGGMIGVLSGHTLYVAGQSRDAAWAQAAWQQAFAVQTIKPFPEKGQTPDDHLSCGEDDAEGICIFSLNGKSLLIRWRDPSDGQKKIPALLCDDMDAVVSTAPLRESCPASPVRLDRFSAWRNGAETLFITSKAVKIVTDSDVQGERPWVFKPGGHGRPNLPLAPAE